MPSSQPVASFLQQIIAFALKMNDLIMDGPTAVAVALVIVPALYVAFKVLRRYLEETKPYSELPMAEGNHFILGHARMLVSSDFVQSFKQLVDSSNEYGQTGAWVIGLRWVSVISVSDARTVLQAEHERRPPRLLKYFNRHFIGDKNLLLINGKEWKFHRGAVARTFNPKFLDGSRKAMQETTETMVATLKRKVGCSGKELDVEPIMKMITLDLFGRIALSTDFGLCSTMTPSPLVTAFEYLLTGTLTRLRAPYLPKNLFFWLPYEQNIVHNKERNLIRSFVGDLINEKKDSLKDDDQDLLSHLIRAHQNAAEGQVSDDNVSDEAMTDVLMTLLFAGYGKMEVVLK
jgi:cytochrome P450